MERKVYPYHRRNVVQRPEQIRTVEQLLQYDSNVRADIRRNLLYKQCSFHEAWSAFAENVKVWFNAAPCNALIGNPFSMTKRQFHNELQYGDNHNFKTVVELAKLALKTDNLTYFVQIR